MRGLSAASSSPISAARRAQLKTKSGTRDIVRWSVLDNIVEMIALTAQFLLTNFMNNAVQTPIDFPEFSPAKAV